MSYSFLAPHSVTTLPVILSSSSSCILVYCVTLSNLTTTLLCVYRLLAVARPFLVPNKTVTYSVVCVLGALAGLSTYLMFIVSLSDEGVPQWSSSRMTIMSSDSEVNYRSFKGILYRLMFVVNAAAAVAVSVLGGVVLWGRRHGTADQNRSNLCRSLGTLIIMNIVYGFVTIYMFTLLGLAMADINICNGCDDRWALFVYLIAYPLAPMTLSVFNPVLLILRGTEIKQFVFRNIPNKS